MFEHTVRPNRNFRAALFFVIAFLLASPVHGAHAVIYVKTGATGADDGSSWEDAFTDLQTALSIAAAEDTIWVASGTYKPTPGTDRTASFSLKNGVALFGGFAGTETMVSERDMRANRTVLSGELGAFGKDDNSFHVVSGENTNSTAVLDGFVITAGNASGSFPNDRGGGLILTDASPTVRNVAFKRNSAVWGGGMSAKQSDPKLTNVTSSGNFAAFGGGLFAYDGSQVIITNGSFAGDSVQWQGAAIYNNGSHSELVNSIVWANEGITKVFNIGDGTTTFRYSIVEGSGGSGGWDSSIGIDGGNNMDVDPIFLSVLNADLHLSPGSPAIDVGDGGVPNLAPTDIEGDPRVVGVAIDIGADEFDDPTSVALAAAVPSPRVTSVYPNPFNPTVTVSFELDTRREVRAVVHDVRGRRVRTLFEGVRNSGPHRVTGDATDDRGNRVVSGVYFIEVQSHGWRDSRKVTLVK